MFVRIGVRIAERDVLADEQVSVVRLSGPLNGGGEQAGLPVGLFGGVRVEECVACVFEGGDVGEAGRVETVFAGGHVFAVGLGDARVAVGRGIECFEDLVAVAACFDEPPRVLWVAVGHFVEVSGDCFGVVVVDAFGF